MRPIRLPKNVKKVCVCHDLSMIRYLKFFSLKSRIWYFLNNPKRYFKSASKVISVSNFTKNELREVLGVESEVVYNGVRLVGCADTESVKKKYNLPEKYLMSLSTLEPRKNLKRVIEAFSKASLEGFELVLAGDFDEKIFAKLKLPNVKNVRFIGAVAEFDKEALYKMSSGLVYVSLYEGFGLPVIEAFSCGCPVLTSENSSMQEISGGLALYADPLSVESISEGMKKLATWSGDRQKLIVKASEFNWGKTASVLLRHIVV